MNEQLNEQRTTLQPATHALAIISLILSILGLTPFLPFLGSIGGIITGVIARREIRTNRDRYSGEGLAKAGIILGWIGVGVLILAACGFLLFLLPMRTETIQGPPIQVITVQP